jgi:hypothetical protein
MLGIARIAIPAGIPEGLGLKALTSIDVPHAHHAYRAWSLDERGSSVWFAARAMCTHDTRKTEPHESPRWSDCC